MLLVANLVIWPIYRLVQKILDNDWNPVTWVPIWEYSVRVIQCIPTWQGLNGYQKSLHSYSLEKGSLSIGRVKRPYMFNYLSWVILPANLLSTSLIPFPPFLVLSMKESCWLAMTSRAPSPVGAQLRTPRGFKGFYKPPLVFKMCEF